MDNRDITKGKSRKKSRLGILIGIPLFLFISGVTLVSVGTYNYMRYAYYLSRLFIHDEFKPADNKLQITNEKVGKKITFPKFGEEFGELTIPKASIDVPVFNGDMEDELLKGVGHFNGSRFPGEGGNVVLAGHRNSVFKNLKNVAQGDDITLNTTYGKYVYKITGIRIAKGTDQTIVQPADHEMLTIYTCYPFDYIGSAPNRYVVTCDLVEGTPVKDLMSKGETN